MFLCTAYMRTSIRENEERKRRKRRSQVNHKVLAQQGPTQFRLSAHPVTRYTRKVSSSFPTHLRFGFFKVRLVHSATRASHFRGSLVCTQVIFFACRALLGSHTFIDLNFSFRVENGIEAKYLCTVRTVNDVILLQY